MLFIRAPLTVRGELRVELHRVIAAICQLPKLGNHLRFPTLLPPYSHRHAVRTEAKGWGRAGGPRVPDEDDVPGGA
jgi:hypothetical protein